MITELLEKVSENIFINKDKISLIVCNDQPLIHRCKWYNYRNY